MLRSLAGTNFMCNQIRLICKIPEYHKASREYIFLIIEYYYYYYDCQNFLTHGLYPRNTKLTHQTTASTIYIYNIFTTAVTCISRAGIIQDVSKLQQTRFLLLIAYV